MNCLTDEPLEDIVQERHVLANDGIRCQLQHSEIMRSVVHSCFRIELKGAIYIIPPQRVDGLNTDISLTP